MGDYWLPRWHRMSERLASQDIAAFRSNDIGHDIVRQQYKPGEAEKIINWTASRVPAVYCADPLVGTPKRVADVSVDGHTLRVTPDSCMFAYSAHTLAHHLAKDDDVRRLRIIEIGPGYCGLVERMAAHAPPEIDWYISVDGRVPQKVQRYFLEASATELDARFTQTLDASRVAEANLVIASHCFGEMTPVEVNDYIHFIESHILPGAYFYIITWKHESLHSGLVGKCSRLSDYIFDSRWETLINGPWPYDSNPCVEMLLRRIE